MKPDLQVIDLDAELLEKRFGAPAERVTKANGASHWLQPDRGLDLVVRESRKEALQFVAPRDFERLLEAPIGDKGAR